MLCRHPPSAPRLNPGGYEKRRRQALASLKQCSAHAEAKAEWLQAALQEGLISEQDAERTADELMGELPSEVCISS